MQNLYREFVYILPPPSPKVNISYNQIAVIKTKKLSPISNVLYWTIHLTWISSFPTCVLFLGQAPVQAPPLPLVDLFPQTVTAPQSSCVFHDVDTLEGYQFLIYSLFGFVWHSLKIRVPFLARIPQKWCHTLSVRLFRGTGCPCLSLTGDVQFNHLVKVIISVFLL